MAHKDTVGDVGSGSGRAVRIGVRDVVESCIEPSGERIPAGDRGTLATDERFGRLT